MSPVKWRGCSNKNKIVLLCEAKQLHYCFLDDLQVTTYQELCKAALKTHQALFSSLKVSLQIALLELYNLERIMRYLNDFRKSEEKKR